MRARSLRMLAWPIGVALVAGSACSRRRRLVEARADRVHILARSCSRRSWSSSCAAHARPARCSCSISRNRRRYGGYIVHAAVVLLAIGIAGSSAYGTDARGEAAARPVDDAWPGTSSRTSSRIRSSTTPNRTKTYAVLNVTGHWQRDDQVRRRDVHRLRRDRREVGIKTDWLRGQDLYVIADFEPHSKAVLLQGAREAADQPDLARGIVFVLGSLVALWPDAREQRRLVTRLALARA